MPHSFYQKLTVKWPINWSLPNLFQSIHCMSKGTSFPIPNLEKLITNGSHWGSRVLSIFSVYITMWKYELLRYKGWWWLIDGRVGVPYVSHRYCPSCKTRVMGLDEMEELLFVYQFSFIDCYANLPDFPNVSFLSNPLPRKRKLNWSGEESGWVGCS